MDTKHQNPKSEINIEELQKQIAAALGITNLNDRTQKEVIEKATEVLLKKLFLDTIDKLSEEDAKAYGELLEKDTTAPDDIEKFLSGKIPNRTGTTQETIEQFIADIKSAATK